MGMDIFGKHPTSPIGGYFRRNIWGWHPLASLVEFFGGEIVTHCRRWHTNDGDGLDAADSHALAVALENALKDGRIAAYLWDREEHLASLPEDAHERLFSLSIEDVREFAAFLSACGGFEIL